MGSRPFEPIKVPHNAVLSDTPTARRVLGGMAKNKNENFVFTGDANMRRIPAFYIGIWNVSDIEQKIERPWVNPRPDPSAPEKSLGKIIIIPARGDSERYSKPFLIPDILQEPVERAGSWEVNVRGVDGKFLAQDALNPEDMRGSWKTVRPVAEAALVNEGTNLYHLGLFWEVAGPHGDDPPSEEAITTAEKRLVATYNRLVQEANLLFMQGAPGQLRIGHLHRHAANYLRVNVPWNQQFERQNQCSNCGTTLPVTASRCFNCKKVINWERALAEGTATPEEAIAAGINAPQAESMNKKKKKAAEE
jgi:hypothetical protein